MFTWRDRKNAILDPFRTTITTHSRIKVVVTRG